MKSEVAADFSREPDPGSLGNDLGEMAAALWQRAWLVALGIVIGGGIAVGYIVTARKLYASTAVVQVELKQRPVMTVRDASGEDLKSPDVVKTIEQNLSVDSLLLRVIKVNHLSTDTIFLSQFEPGPVSRFVSSLKEMVSSEPVEKTERTDSRLIGVLDERVKATLRRGSRLIDVVVRDEDPARARLLCESMLTEYAKMNFEQMVETSKPANDYLIKESERLKQKLEKSEQRLQAYREEKQAVSLEDKQNIIVDMLKDVNLKLGSARAERLKLESDLAQVERCGGKIDELLSVAGIAASQDVLTLKAKVSEQAGMLANLKERYSAESPKYAQAESQLQNLNAALETTVRQVAAQIKGSFESARATEQKFLDSLREQEQQALELSRNNIQYNVLSRDVDSDRALYQAVLTQMKESQVIQGVDDGNIRVVSPPSLPDKPVSPKKTIALALGLFLGLTMGAGTSLGLHFFKAPLMSVAHAERVLALRALGAIPKSRLIGSSGQPPLVRPTSPGAEAFRTLRAAIALQTQEEDGRSVLFASAAPGEGKTFCAVNFAASLAREGLRTLLIDADLRCPRIGGYFLGGEQRPGFGEVLAGQIEFSKAVSPTKVNHLDVLPAGNLGQDAAELLEGDRVGRLLETALAAYDRIVIDSAPVLPVSDALLIAKHIHSVCLVVLARKTPARYVQRTQQLLQSATGRPLVGFVLNRVRRQMGGYDSYA